MFDSSLIVNATKGDVSNDSRCSQLYAVVRDLFLHEMQTEIESSVNHTLFSHLTSSCQNAQRSHESSNYDWSMESSYHSSENAENSNMTFQIRDEDTSAHRNQRKNNDRGIDLYEIQVTKNHRVGTIYKKRCSCLQLFRKRRCRKRKF